ncbi:hypothetical protein Goarm_020299 [Gossypium armourianum]|uniref:Uncharacterized protein n=1 Tax=Gossypium armourianum TaxID=34283 RepID=A0A7J9IPN0_9ROSI|nr:hypothetical protein [Gossypium armourianum]
MVENMEKSMSKAELSKEMRSSPTVHPTDCENGEAPINYQQLLKLDEGFSNYYPYAKLKNIVMVVGHSIYTSSSCKKVDNEDSWFLEP